jgi:5-enolpyruvylshikimate-3-phosphate synthase
VTELRRVHRSVDVGQMMKGFERLGIDVDKDEFQRRVFEHTGNRAMRRSSDRNRKKK